MCALLERLEQMAVAQMAAKDAATLRYTISEITRLRTELQQARAKAQKMTDSSIELLTAIDLLAK